jgi:hypothetical protein
VSAAAERLLKVHNIRAFELFLANVAASTKSPAFVWSSAVVAVVTEQPAPLPDAAPWWRHLWARWWAVEPTVVVMIGMRGIAWLALGVLHLIAWWRVRRTIGKHRQGYRVRVRFG